MTDELWVFGYGSLVWDPGFEVAETKVARLNGFHRSFCMWSIHHRGSQDDPGLVLALDALDGGRCDGVALQVPKDQHDDTMAYLRERELISSAYLEQFCDVELTDGRKVRAVTYVIDPDHIQYCGDLTLEHQAQVIAKAVGGRGPNTEYLYNTVQHLGEYGIEDADLTWLVNRVKRLTAD